MVLKKSKTSASKPQKSGEPRTMEELLAMYGASVRRFSLGDKVTGTITEKLPGKVIVDIGGKSEGVIAEKAYKESESLIKTLNVGDEIHAQVIVSETPDGYTVLSLRQATADASWKKIDEAKEKGTPIAVEVKNVTSAGVMTEISGLTGFIPKSQLGREVSKNIQNMIGKKIEVTVIDSDRGMNKVVLSEKEVSEKEEMALAKSALGEIKDGDVFEGVVTTIYDFGCFVKIETVLKKTKEKIELEGLVHISELSWDKVAKSEDVVEVGDKVKVKVIGKSNGKLALSIKQVKGDPWFDVAEKYKKDTRIEGEVVKLTDFGVFVQLQPGIEGLIHMTKIPPGKKLSKGDKVNVYIEEIDPIAKKISLGLVLTEKPVGYR